MRTTDNQAFGQLHSREHQFGNISDNRKKTFEYAFENQPQMIAYKNKPYTTQQKKHQTDLISKDLRPPLSWIIPRFEIKKERIIYLSRNWRMTSGVKNRENKTN